MLSKRIDLGSKPIGLYNAKAELAKGRLVKFEGQQVVYATNDDEAVGFCTLRIDTQYGGVLDHDVIPAGKKVVVYTLDKEDIWLTTECEGIDKLKVGDKVKCGSEGKLKKDEGGPEEGAGARFEVVEISRCADKPAVGVRVLR